jgi:hypothetical protein
VNDTRDIKVAKKLKSEKSMNDNNNRPVDVYTHHLAISSNSQENWYICWSPDRSEIGSEGPWEEWVSLAEAILKENDKIRNQSQSVLVEAKSEQSYGFTS